MLVPSSHGFLMIVKAISHNFPSLPVSLLLLLPSLGVIA